MARHSTGVPCELSASAGKPAVFRGENGMTDTSAAVPLSGWRAITPYQWLVFGVVWAGWTLDAADFGLFSLVLKPALTDLLGFSSTAALDKGQLADIGRYGGL